MAIGSGIGSWLGIKKESVFNTAVTVDRFYEFNSESIKYMKNTVVGQGLRSGGLVPRANRRVVTTFASEGDFEIDLPSRGLGLLLSLATGSVPTGTLANGAYTYAFVPQDLVSDSFTTQVAVPQYGGTLTYKTLTGCKIGSFELSVGAGEIAKGKFTLDGAGFTSTSSTSATPAYSNFATTNLFHFAQGSITDNVSTTYANIKDFSLSVDNTLKTDRYNLGAAGAKAEQIINGFRAITGTITAEFTDTVLLDKFIADTTAGLKVSFRGADIGTSAGSTYELLEIVLPACKFDGDNPVVEGPGTIDVSFTFTVYDDGTNAPFTINYVTKDSTL
jgi:hypothetical protein